MFFDSRTLPVVLVNPFLSAKCYHPLYQYFKELRFGMIQTGCHEVQAAAKPCQSAGTGRVAGGALERLLFAGE